jgi:hypothetical protein
MKTISAFILIFIMSACAQLQEKSADAIADGIISYCNEIDQATRATTRKNVNAKLAEKGHSIIVECDGDIQ